MGISGVWLPVITPFSGDEIDFESYETLLEHYIEQGIHGIIPLGTTGECPAISAAELEEILLEQENPEIRSIAGLIDTQVSHMDQGLRLAADL